MKVNKMSAQQLRGGIVRLEENVTLSHKRRIDDKEPRITGKPGNYVNSKYYQHLQRRVTARRKFDITVMPGTHRRNVPWYEKWMFPPAPMR